MDNSDCGTGALWVENGSVEVDSGSGETLWVQNQSVGVDTGNSGVDTPEVDPEVYTSDVFPFVTLHSGRYSSSSPLLTVSVVTCIMSCR